MQVQVCLLIDFFAIFVYANPCGVEDISAAEGQNRALIDRGNNGVLDDIQRRGCVHRDVLGAGGHGRRNLSDGRSLIVVERLLSADGILTCYGDRINIVMDNGLHAEGLGGDDSVLANTGLCLGVHVSHGEGRAHAYASAASHLLAGLVLDGQAVVGSGGGSDGIDLVGGLGVQLQNTVQLHIVLLAAHFQIGEDGLCVRVEDGQGKAARHAHVGAARAGDGGGADAVAHIFQLTGVAVLGGKLGNGGFQQEVQADRGHHLLRRQFLTDFVGGCRVVHQGGQQEFGIEEQVCQIGKQAVCQSHRSGGDGAQRIALDIGEHDLEDHILRLLIIGKFSCLTVLIIVLGQKLLVRPVLTVEVSQQGILTRLIQKGILENNSAGIGIRKVVQKLIDDFVHAAAVCRFQDVRADNEIVRLDGLRAHIGLVLILHIVDCRCHAHADGAVAGGGVREDHGVGIFQSCDAHIACGRNGRTVRDAGKGLVGMHIRRDGSRYLYAALGGLHTGHLVRQTRCPRCGHGAVLSGQAVEIARRIAQGGGVVFVDLLRLAVPVHGGGRRSVLFAAQAAEQAREILNGDVRGTGGGDHRYRGGALGAGVDVLADAADGLRRHRHAAGLHAAVERRHGGVVQHGKTHCRACACPAAHCLGVGDELADGLGVRGDDHIAGHLGHGAVELTHNRLGVHRAEGQRHDRCDGDAAGGTGRGLNVEVCLVVRLCFQRVESGIAEVDAVLNLRDCVDVDYFHRDARAHARGVRGHLEGGHQRNTDAADLDALSGPLAGGVGHGGVSAGAGGDDFHIAAVNVIACRIAEHCFVVDIDNVDGNRAADAQLGLIFIGGVACLGNGLGSGVQGLGFNAQILRADSALADACFVAVHQHFEGNRRADGVFRRSLPAHIGAAHADDGRCAVQGSVGPQIGYAAAGGMNQERRGSGDAFYRIHLRLGCVVDVHHAQRAHHLIHARRCG